MGAVLQMCSSSTFWRAVRGVTSSRQNLGKIKIHCLRLPRCLLQHAESSTLHLPQADCMIVNATADNWYSSQRNNTVQSKIQLKSRELFLSNYRRLV